TCMITGGTPCHRSLTTLHSIARTRGARVGALLGEERKYLLIPQVSLLKVGDKDVLQHSLHVLMLALCVCKESA
ncbi:MAG TPA: hypothetical protein PLX97_04045, partial [Gemmatales bacterium]|nr:hypothetical protein [Gemmatales bacterium]